MIGIILAGGSGTRLWPKSRKMYPKQFMGFTSGDHSLLQQTILRLDEVVDPEKLWIVGSKKHDISLLQQIRSICPGFSEERVLLEPQGRNTAPAILWAISQLSQKDLDEPIAIMPSDHLIADPRAFGSALTQAESLAKDGMVVIFGIKPDRPETGYGYIKRGKPLDTGYKVERFMEKPDLKTAEEFIRSGEYGWNAGIFMATGRSLLKEFEKHSPGLYQAFCGPKSSARLQNVGEVFEQIESISFDYAILEKSDKVAVLNIEVGWNDLGSWESIHQVNPKDENENVVFGDAVLQDCKGSLIFSEKKLVTAIGVENLLVVDTHDALLVCDLSRSQDVKNLVTYLENHNRPELEFGPKVGRPWGNFVSLYNAPGYQVKLIEVSPRKRISLQKHQHRSEHWIVLSGKALVTNEDRQMILNQNESTYISKTALHRLENPTDEPLKIIEVQLGDYLAEDDIQRFDDDFGRNQN